MTTNVKLTKVLEYLIKNDEEKAKELLHQVFIEKARAIHEELMGMDEDAETDMEMDEGMDMHAEEEDMDETVGGSGDEGKDLTNEIEAMEDEIDFEETMTEAGDDEDEVEAEVDVEGPADAEPADGDEGVGAIAAPLSSLEAALADLRAEYDRIQSGESGGENDASAGDAEEVDVEMTEEMDDDGEQHDESWDLEEDFDELAESLDLEVIEKDVLKTNKSAKDIGAASSGMTTGNDAKSPLPKSQTARMGAKPVETGKGSTASGYNLESAPKSADMGLGDNRRKKASDGSKAVPAPKNSDGASNKMSPLSKGGDNLK